MFDSLTNANRLLLEARLTPVQGDRFQPTGFADIGAATYTLPDGTRMLLVESAQSMANRFEATILGPDNELIPELAGLSYVRAKLQGDADTWTNSLIEAHRINSPFIISNKKFLDDFKTLAEYRQYHPLNWKKIAAALFSYDVNSILHGVFLANVEDGRVRLQRALSACIEAKNVREVVSGGVKNNPIDPTGKLRAAEITKDVYSNVPYQRVEFTAEEITASCNVDVGLLRSYGLEKDAVELLLALACYKIRVFFDGGLRLRTACDFKLAEDLTVLQPQEFELPDQQTLLEFLQQKIKDCKEMFASPPVTEFDTPVKIKKSKDDE
jgi:CRISPR-associated protein Csb1